LWGYWN